MENQSTEVIKVKKFISHSLSKKKKKSGTHIKQEKAK